MTQPDEQNKGQQPDDEATAPFAATPPVSGTDSEPTAIVEPSPAPPVWGEPPAAPVSNVPMSPPPPSPWAQPTPSDPAATEPFAAADSPGTADAGSPPPASPWAQPNAAPGSPAAPSAWTPPPGSPAVAGSPAAPGSPVGQASVSPSQAAQAPQPGQPGQPPQPGVPLPPGWGQQPQPGQPAQPTYQPPVDPFHTTTMTPTSAQLPYNPYGSVEGGGQGMPPGYTPEQTQLLQPPPKKKNKALMITAIVLGVVVLLCAVGGVGAFLLINNSEGKGAESAKDAAQDFLTAVYKDHDSATAEKLVCNEARDRKAIDAKIKEIEDQKGKLKGPSITWDTPKIDNETAEQANTTVTIKLTTSDEKLSEQTIKLTLVKHDGWFVCEVEEQKK